MDPTLLKLLVSLLLSGGLITAVVSVYNAHKKTPVERDNIIVSGAETAVLALERSLKAETARANRAESSLASRDQTIATKDALIERMQARLDEVQRTLDEVRAELASIITAHS